MGDYDIGSVFDPEDVEDVDTKPSIDNPREVMNQAFQALVRAMNGANSPSDSRQAANALLKFLREQGLGLEGGEMPEWVPPPSYMATLTYHLALLFGEGGLNEPGERRTELADAAVRASALGHTGGPVFSTGLDHTGKPAIREEGAVNIPSHGRVPPPHWEGAEVIGGDEGASTGGADPSTAHPS